MSKIYNDIAQPNDKEKKMLENLLSMGTVIAGEIGVKFRDNEINRVYNIMDKAEYRSVMLVGDHGCGKRSIIDGYVEKLKDNLRSDMVIEIDFLRFLANAQASDFNKILDDIFYTATQCASFNIVLVLNNIGHYLNLNCFGSTGFSFINKLINAIENSNLKIITTATTNEYKTVEDFFDKVLDFFTVIKLNDLTIEQTSEIISDNIDYFKNHYSLNLPENISELICTNADKYIKEKAFPGKAENLLDEVCSSISNKYRPISEELLEIDKQISKLKTDLETEMKSNDYVKCNEITKTIQELTAKFNELAAKEDEFIDVTEADILEAIGNIVNVKMSKLSKDQTEFLREMPVELKKNVIGQDEAVDTIVKNIRRNQLGLRKSGHSAGNFMFIGSTGVGKTYLAKQLAKYLYGSEDNFLRLDMSEFQSEIDVSKLLGSAPGYVGYKESGLLVKGLAKKHETVVLFDEIEKAHPKIYDVLLQLLDEGFVTGSDGNKVDATKSLIIFTSNIGVKQAQSMSNPLGFSNDNDDTKKNDKKEKIIRKALKNRFSPEFLNRLDNICYFNALSEDTLRLILYKELGESNEGIFTITGKRVVLSPEAERWILEKVKKEDNGARPVIRTIQQNIEEPISDMVVNEDPALNNGSDILTAYLENDKLILR